ncbi:nucleoside hydrolase [Actinacidiphila soli]|uniref:nucleoside hydrolase n=1 Tax=Actinacidiphila soli TaxID=2487275 RepID=UPI000FC9AF80|nr:nucleoside hydrolase [Actinacidiphila soli]
MNRKRIIVDTDPGIDDALAILYLLGCEDADVVGVTTVAGNADIDIVTSNALSILELVGRSDIPVAAGAHGPLNGQRPPKSSSSHGADGLGSAPRPVPQRQAVDLGAADFIASVVSESLEPVSILAIAPLTNIATFCQRYPELLPKIQQIVIMGGVFGAGNVTPYAEFNTWSDPEAAEIVFASPVSTLLVPLDVTNHVTLDTADLAAVPPGPVHDFLTTANEYYADAREVRTGSRLTVQHDAGAAVCLMHPDIFGVAEGAVVVNCDASPRRGQTTQEPFPSTDGVTKRIATDHNQHSFQQELLRSLQRLASTTRT